MSMPFPHLDPPTALTRITYDKGMVAIRLHSYYPNRRARVLDNLREARFSTGGIGHKSGFHETHHF